MRDIIHLNYNWKYIEDFKEDYLQEDIDLGAFKDVNIPHANIELPYNNFDQEEYQFISTYKKSIFIDEEHKNKNAILHFEGVMTYAKVYLNGSFICEHKGGYTPFECDITDHINYGKENSLTLMVDSTERDDIPPFGYAIDYLTYGGIYREVWLEFVEDIYVENMQIKTRNVLKDHKLLDIDIYINNNTYKLQVARVEFNLIDNAKTILTFEKEISVENRSKLNIQKEIKGVNLWDIDNPHLYKMEVRVYKDDKLIDEYKDTFGFREAIFKTDGFYLNGRRLKLRGLNRHQSYPYVGYAMPKSAQERDAEILKYDLGVNLVRLSHYPQSKQFLDRCDEIGLLVFEEIPGWQHIGDEEWQDIAIKNVEEMITRDWNRPSIILWGVRINESPDNDEFYKETNRVAKSLDDTRQTGGVRNLENSSFFEDVYTFNDFVHRGNNIALRPVKEITKKNVPYMVTEYNGHMFPTKKFDNEERRVEHALRHLRVLDALYMDDRISGAIGWCMADYNTHKDFGSGDLICYHGVMDMFRIPKEAAGVYKSQDDSYPYLSVASTMIMGDRAAAELTDIYIFTNCDYVKFYKNEQYIKTFYPAKDKFPNIPNPPIIIDDFVGDLIEKNERFSKKDAKIIKDTLHAVVKYGDKTLPLKYKLNMARIMFKYKLNFEDGLMLYTKYMGNWGTKSLKYKFEGYKDDKLVATSIKGPANSSKLLVIPDNDKILEDQTYDVCRIVVKHVDEYDNTLVYSNENINLEIEGVGEIIGPKNITLIGGSIAFWVKSKGQSGNIKVRVVSERYGTKEIEIDVEGFIPINS